MRAYEIIAENKRKKHKRKKNRTPRSITTGWWGGYFGSGEGGDGGGVEESNKGVAEGLLNEIYKMPPTKNSSQGMAIWAYNDAVGKKSPILYKNNNVIVFKANENLLRYIALQDGNPVLYIGLSKFLDGYKSGAVATEIAGRGKGLAQKAYLNASDILGVPIYSDTTQTDASRLGIWNKLIQQYPDRIVGYDQKTNKNLPLTLSDKGPTVNQNQPIYVDRNEKYTNKPITPDQRYRTRILKLLPNKQGVAEGQIKDSSISPKINIQSHRSGNTVWLDYFEVMPRNKGFGTKVYKKWEQELPGDIKEIRLIASDAGEGPSHEFWDRMGFYYVYDDDNGPIEMVKKLNEKQGVAEGSEKITEYRDRMYQYIKSVLPKWPDYVLQDYVYRVIASKNYTKDEFNRNGILTLIKNIGLSPNTKWQLIPNFKFHMDMWEPNFREHFIERSREVASNKIDSKRDAERHATQAQIANKEGGVSKQPILLIKYPNGYVLLEGWHRTIQHFLKYPDSYTGPAYVATAQDQQGVAEGQENKMSAEEYKQNLLDKLPFMMKFLSGVGKGWTPSEQDMLAGIEIGYEKMKQTGDVKQAGAAMQQYLNTLHKKVIDTAKHMYEKYRGLSYTAHQRASDHAISYESNTRQFRYWSSVADEIRKLEKETSK